MKLIVLEKIIKLVDSDRIVVIPINSIDVIDIKDHGDHQDVSIMVGGYPYRLDVMEEPTRELTLLCEKLDGNPTTVNSQKPLNIEDIKLPPKRKKRTPKPKLV